MSRMLPTTRSRSGYAPVWTMGCDSQAIHAPQCCRRQVAHGTQPGDVAAGWRAHSSVSDRRTLQKMGTTADLLGKEILAVDEQVLVGFESHCTGDHWRSQALLRGGY